MPVESWVFLFLFVLCLIGANITEGPRGDACAVLSVVFLGLAFFLSYRKNTI
jgi:hypothetical protein